MNRQFGFGQPNDPLQSLNLTVSYPLHFVLESFFQGRSSPHLLSKFVWLDHFMKYTFIPSISNGISITFWGSILSQILSPQTLCPCKSTIIVTSSSLSFVLQMESFTRIKKYVPLYKMDGFRRYWDYSSKHPLLLFNSSFIRWCLLEVWA